jgi:nuclear transport factor 2 (NTF2) superfamily protein
VTESRTVRLAIDFENPGTEWWNSGGRDLWEALAQGFDENAVVLESSIAESWLSQAAQLPGWEGGPEFSPHPICLRELHDDEEV